LRGHFFLAAIESSAVYAAPIIKARALVPKRLQYKFYGRTSLLSATAIRLRRSYAI